MAGFSTSGTAGGGKILQVVDVINYTTHVTTNSTTMPFDDTIPQITEGDEYLTVSITPERTSNRLVIEAHVRLSSNQANVKLTAALFQDSTADALAASAQEHDGSNDATQVHIFHEMQAGTTSSTTFRIRAGAESAGTTTFNGTSGARTFGGVGFSTIIVREYRA